MRYPNTIIESRWGAVGTVVVLQCYGLMAAYFFASAVDHALSTKVLDELPGHLLEIGVGLTFLAIFIYAQGALLTDVANYLWEARDLPGWFYDAVRPQGILRVLITAAAIVLYVGLLTGRVTLGFPELNLFILLGYQVFHPIASHFVGKYQRKTHFPTEIRYISAARQLFNIVMCQVGAALFYGFGVLMKHEHEHAYWLTQMMGCGVAVFGITQFLLEDVKSRYREVFIEDKDAARH